MAAFLLCAPASAHHLDTKVRTAEHLRPGCPREYPMRHFYEWGRHKYHVRERPLTDGQKLWVKHLALCLATREKSDWAYDKWRRWKTRFHRRLALYRVTPYVCGFGRSAIPCYVVYCESGGSWYARNPSGAVGIYQLLGWGAIYPATTFAARLQNHRIAYHLWNGGAGASNWVCA